MMHGQPSLLVSSPRTSEIVIVRKAVYWKVMLGSMVRYVLRSRKRSLEAVYLTHCSRREETPACEVLAVPATCSRFPRYLTTKEVDYYY
jgi:hypothetical protein